MTLFKTEEYDYFLYDGDISRSGYEQLTECMEKLGTKRKNWLCLVLRTRGGDPSAGYRIGRAIGHYYNKNVVVFVPSYCKSAGTLLCIAAHELAIADTGELGPLDIQISKKDEMFERSSSLDITSAMDQLKTFALNTYREFLVEVKLGTGIGTKIASSVAVELTRALVEPVVSQIDPQRLGEHSRATMLAMQYGERLNHKFDNLKNSTSLSKLIAHYPQHGFVIDRKEAKTLFKNVSEPSEDQQLVWKVLTDNPMLLEGNLNVYHLNDVLSAVEQKLSSTNGESILDEEGVECDGEDPTTPEAGRAADIHAEEHGCNPCEQIQGGDADGSRGDEIPGSKSSS